MLTTIIYRSHISKYTSEAEVKAFIEQANPRNQALEVTGILLFDGVHFLQLLEGPEDAVESLYHKICRDKRHYTVVMLLRDFSVSRHFGKAGMELFDLRDYPPATVLDAVLARGTSTYNLTYDDRTLQFIKSFVEEENRDYYLELSEEHNWQFVANQSLVGSPVQAIDQQLPFTFVFEPIVSPLTKKIATYEAKMRTAQGQSPLSYFSSLTREEMYRVDLEAKCIALRMAKDLALDHATISLKLFPMTLVTHDNAVDVLLKTIEHLDLVPEQVIISVSEDSVIGEEAAFTEQVMRLKRAGIRLALDDFGAGTAGLLLLTRIQPEQVKLASDITRGVHKAGPQQAITQAIIKICSSLEISLVAVDIKQAEEWLWLDLAGIDLYQGSLFSTPTVAQQPIITWPMQA